jgi:hypothetical protein
LTICSLTKKGRAAFADYAEKLKKVSEATTGLMTNKV